LFFNYDESNQNNIETKTFTELINKNENSLFLNDSYKFDLSKIVIKNNRILLSPELEKVSFLNVDANNDIFDNKSLYDISKFEDDIEKRIIKSTANYQIDSNVKDFFKNLENSAIKPNNFPDENYLLDQNNCKIYGSISKNEKNIFLYENKTLNLENSYITFRDEKSSNNNSNKSIKKISLIKIPEKDLLKLINNSENKEKFINSPFEQLEIEENNNYKINNGFMKNNKGKMTINNQIKEIKDKKNIKCCKNSINNLQLVTTQEKRENISPNFIQKDIKKISHSNPANLIKKHTNSNKNILINEESIDYGYENDYTKEYHYLMNEINFDNELRIGRKKLSVFDEEIDYKTFRELQNKKKEAKSADNTKPNIYKDKNKLKYKQI